MKKLKSFFSPKTIAVIGASDLPEKVGGILMNKLENFKGKVIPINPTHKIVKNKKSYPSVLNYKRKIDLAVIATPPNTIPSILKDCVRKKLKNIIIITAGFSEAGNTKQEKQITLIAKKHKLNILGPNCFGIVNTKLNLDTTFAASTPKKGNIALISQSGALWSYISDLEVGFSKFASLGNMSDIEFTDLIRYLNKDKSTKKIICYIEKLKNGKQFIEACKKSKKEIIIIKAGKTKGGEQAAISHTGSLASEYNIYKGAFKQAKVKQVESLAEALDIKSNLRTNPSGRVAGGDLWEKTKSTAIITNAGGAGILITDFLEQKGIKIKKSWDILGTATANDYKKALTKFSKKYKHITVILTPQQMSQPTETAKIISQFKKPKITAFFLGGKSVEEAKKILEKNKIRCYTKI